MYVFYGLEKDKAFKDRGKINIRSKSDDLTSQQMKMTTPVYLQFSCSMITGSH